MDLSSNFECFNRDVVKNLRKLELLLLRGEGYKVS